MRERERGIYIKSDNSVGFDYQDELSKTELGAWRVLLQSGGDTFRKVDERLMV